MLWWSGYRKAFQSHFARDGALIRLSVPDSVSDSKHSSSPSQQRVPAEAAAGPDSTGTAGGGSSLLARAGTAAAAGGKAEPGSPASNTGSAATCSGIPPAATAPLLPGAGEQHRHHAGQHLQLRPAQAVHRRPEPRRLGLRHPIVGLLRLQPLLPAVPSRLPQALRQGQRAAVPPGRQPGLARLAVLPAPATAFLRLR